MLNKTLSLIYFFYSHISFRKKVALKILLLSHKACYISANYVFFDSKRSGVSSWNQTIDSMVYRV